MSRSGRPRLHLEPHAQSGPAGPSTGRAPGAVRAGRARSSGAVPVPARSPRGRGSCGAPGPALPLAARGADGAPGRVTGARRGRAERGGAAGVPVPVPSCRRRSGTGWQAAPKGRRELVKPPRSRRRPRPPLLSTYWSWCGATGGWSSTWSRCGTPPRVSAPSSGRCGPGSGSGPRPCPGSHVPCLPPSRQVAAACVLSPSLPRPQLPPAHPRPRCVSGVRAGPLPGPSGLTPFRLFQLPGTRCSPCWSQCRPCWVTCRRRAGPGPRSRSWCAGGTTASAGRICARCSSRGRKPSPRSRACESLRPPQRRDCGGLCSQKSFL